MATAYRSGWHLVEYYPHEGVAGFMAGDRCVLCGHVKGKPCICTSSHVQEPCPNHGELGIVGAIKQHLRQK